MRLYAVALITWTATITAFSESNVPSLNDEKAVDYTELRDSPEKQMAGFHVTGMEARSFWRTDTGDHPDVGSSGSDDKGSNGLNFASDSSTSQVIYATPLAETSIDEYPFKERSRESEEILLVENAGSFGQRVQQGHPSDKTIAGSTVSSTVDDGREDDEYASVRKSISSTASPFQNEGGRPYAPVTSEPYVLALRKENDPSSSSDSEVFESKASDSGEISGLETAKEDSLAPGENDVVPEELESRVRSSRAYNGTETETTATEKPAEPVEKRIVQVSSSTSVEISPSFQPVKFSGPIVVADLADRATPEMTGDYLDDSNAGAGTLRSVPDAEIIPESYAENSRPAASKNVETSSIVLNPLQVGITLENAHETGSVDEQSAATDTKDYLQDYPQDGDLQRLSTVDKKFESDIENRSRDDYKAESFHRVEEGEKSSAEPIAQKVPENSVEIQKSVEIFHTAPVHEIHYPPVYIQQASNLGVIETNNIGRSNQPYGQDEQSESRPNYDVYQGNEQSVDRIVIKEHPSEQKLTTHHQYNPLEDEVDLAKPTASAVIADYASSGVHEQAPVETAVELQPYKYNDAPPVLLVPNQFDDALYDQSNAVRHSFRDNDGASSPHSAKFLTYPSTARQESAGETYQSDQQQQHLPSQQPTINHQVRPQPEVRRPEPQLLLKIIPAGASSNEAFVVPLPRPYPMIEKIVERTVHVPHPIEIEKVIERKVPFPVERVVEKRVQVPVPVAVQPHPVYHVHQVPVVEKQVRPVQVYPIHVERVVEKKMPYVIQRLLVQPSYQSLQLRLPATTERPTAAIAARLSPSRPYRTDAERPADSTDTIKYRHKSASSTNPRDSVTSEAQSETNASHQPYSIPPYGRPITYDYNIDVGKGYVPFSDVKLMILPRKYNSHHHVVLRPQAVTSYTTVPLRQHIVYNLVERNKGSKENEYVGPAPPRKLSQSKTATSVFDAQPSASIAALRRSRQPETQYPGSFRQSKMEYGFKPPMVPSVQYDEMTATAVEN